METKLQRVQQRCPRWTPSSTLCVCQGSQRHTLDVEYPGRQINLRADERSGLSEDWRVPRQHRSSDDREGLPVFVVASVTIAALFDDKRTEAAHIVMCGVVAEGAIVAPSGGRRSPMCCATPCNEGAAVRPLSIGRWQRASRNRARRGDGRSRLGIDTNLSSEEEPELLRKDSPRSRYSRVRVVGILRPGAVCRCRPKDGGGPRSLTPATADCE